MLSNQEINNIINVIKSEFIKIEDYFIKSGEKYVNGSILDVNFNSVGIKIIFKDKTTNKQMIRSINWKNFINMFNTVDKNEGMW